MARIRVRVAAPTPGRSLRAKDTVPLETPAERATSSIVGRLMPGGPWNEFLWPFLITKQADLQPLAVALANYISNVAGRASNPYGAVIRRVLPQATIVVDHRHLVRLANQALTEVRQRVTRQQLRTGRHHVPAPGRRRVRAARSATLPQVHRGGPVDADGLRATIQLDEERTLGEDIGFGLRQDRPGTAELTVDVPQPDFAAHLSLAIDEIAPHRADSDRAQHRIRDLLGDLEHAARPEHRPALVQALTPLHRAAGEAAGLRPAAAPRTPACGDGAGAGSIPATGRRPAGGPTLPVTTGRQAGGTGSAPSPRWWRA